MWLIKLQNYNLLTGYVPSEPRTQTDKVSHNRKSISLYACKLDES